MPQTSPFSRYNLQSAGCRIYLEQNIVFPPNAPSRFNRAGEGGGGGREQDSAVRRFDDLFTLFKSGFNSLQNDKKHKQLNNLALEKFGASYLYVFCVKEPSIPAVKGLLCFQISSTRPVKNAHREAFQLNNDFLHLCLIFFKAWRF